MNKLLIAALLSVWIASPRAEINRQWESYRAGYSVSKQTLNGLGAGLVRSGVFNQTAGIDFGTFGLEYAASFLDYADFTFNEANQSVTMSVKVRFRQWTTVLWIFTVPTYTETYTFPITMTSSVVNMNGGKVLRLCPQPLPVGGFGFNWAMRQAINFAIDRPSACLDATSLGTIFPGLPSHMVEQAPALYIFPDRISFMARIKPHFLRNPAASVDYDGDWKADASVTNTSSGQWLIDLAINGFNSAGPADLSPALWTSGADSAAHGDYDGDGITDIAFFRQDGYWMIDKGADGFNGPDMWVNTQWASSGRVPVPADYDGDGVTDLAVISRDGYGSFWSIDFSANGFDGSDVDIPMYIGSGYRAVPADYDGDGRADMAFKDDVTGHWMIDYRADGYGFWNQIYTGWGGANFLPAPADFDGDGKADLAVVENGGYAGWWIDYAVDGFQNGYSNAEWVYGGVGTVALIPAPSDYDGDGKADPAGKTEWGTWVIDYSSNGFGGTDEWLEGWGGLEYNPLHKPAASNTGIHTLKSAYNLAFTLPRDSRVTVTAFTLEGKRIANLYDGRLKEGANSIGWEKGELAAKGMKRGIYLLSVQADRFKTSKRMMFTE